MEPHTKSLIAAANDEDPTFADLHRRSQHNNLSPINRLPPELLILIIRKIHRNHSYEALFAIRSVCKYWMELVDSFPGFWTSASMKDNDNLLSMILQNSKNQLLSIQLISRDKDSWKMPMQSFQDARFLERIVHSVGTWKSIECLSTMSGYHEYVLGLPLHNLETLILEGGDWFSRKYEKPINAPKLRCIDLTRFSLDWSSLSDLRVIRMHMVRDGPFIDQLCSLLQRCPNLEALTICQYVVDWGDNPRNLPSTPVLLSKLQSLVLYYLPHLACSDFLRSIDTPNLHRLEVFRVPVNPDDPYDPIATFQPVGRFLGAYRPPFDNDDLTRLRFIRSVEAMTVVVGNMRSRLWVNRAWTKDILQQISLTGLSATLAEFDPRVSEGIKVIQFSGHECREDMINLCPLLHRHLPSVEELVVTLSTSQGRPDADVVLELLSSPSPLEDGAGWLFPRLTALSLRAGRQSICDGVLGIVEARQTGEVQAIERVSIRKGRIGRDTVAKLKPYLRELRLADTRLTEPASLVNG